MSNMKLLKRLIEKAWEMYSIAEDDEKIYGDCYVEFEERGMRIINPTDLIIKVDATKKKIKEFKKKLEKKK